MRMHKSEFELAHFFLSRAPARVSAREHIVSVDVQTEARKCFVRYFCVCEFMHISS